MSEVSILTIWADDLADRAEVHGLSVLDPELNEYVREVRVDCDRGRKEFVAPEQKLATEETQQGGNRNC